MNTGAICEVGQSRLALDVLTALRYAVRSGRYCCGLKVFLDEKCDYIVVHFIVVCSHRVPVFAPTSIVRLGQRLAAGSWHTPKTNTNQSLPESQS